MNMRTFGLTLILFTWWCPALAWVGVALVIIGALRGQVLGE